MLTVLDGIQDRLRNLEALADVLATATDAASFESLDNETLQRVCRQIWVDARQARIDLEDARAAAAGNKGLTVVE